MSHCLKRDVTNPGGSETTTIPPPRVGDKNTTLHSTIQHPQPPFAFHCDRDPRNLPRSEERYQPTIEILSGGENGRAFPTPHPRSSQLWTQTPQAQFLIRRGSVYNRTDKYVLTYRVPPRGQLGCEKNIRSRACVMTR